LQALSDNIEPELNKLFRKDYLTQTKELATIVGYILYLARLATPTAGRVKSVRSSTCSKVLAAAAATLDAFLESGQGS